MDKKGEFGDIIINISFILIIISCITFALNAIIYYQNSNQACKNLGFKESGSLQNNLAFCRDYEGNIHFVKFSNCDWAFTNEKCVAKEITVGKVEVANG